MTETYIGIDPGKKGGIAFLNDKSVTAFPLPLKEKQYDLLQIKEWVSSVVDPILIIEKAAAMPKQGVTSVFTFGFMTGTLHGIFILLDIPIYVVSARKWKNALFGKGKHTKEEAIQFCMTTYPEIQLVRPRCKIPHDGMAEALCIATYGKQTGLGANNESMDGR